MKPRPGAANPLVPVILVAALSILAACVGRATPTPHAGTPPIVTTEPAAKSRPAVAAEAERPEPHPAVEARGTIVAAATPPPTGSSDARPVAPLEAPSTRPAKNPQRDAAEGANSVYVFSPERTVSASGARSPGGPQPPARSENARPLASGSGTTPSPQSKEAPAGPAAAPGRLQLAIVPAPTTVPVGSVFTVDVIAAAAGSIDDAPFHLRFDPAVVEFVDGAPGEFLSQGGSSVVFLIDGSKVPGDVAVGIGRTERETGATGTGLLCRIRLRGVARGDTALAVVSAKAWDAHGEAVPVEANEGMASVR